MARQQPDFRKLFSDTFPPDGQPTTYSIRRDSNLPHDIAFVSSLVQDARILQRQTAIDDGRIVVPLNRDCWEIPYTHHDQAVELHIANSQLAFTGVESIEWRFKREPDSDPWLSFLWVAKGYRDSHRKRFGFFLVGEDWKCKLALTQDEWSVTLQDQEVPYLWSSRNGGSKRLTSRPGGVK